MPDCPGAAALKVRMAPLAERHPDVEVIWQVVTTEDQARAWGMAGSPTLLIDGDDPFARPGQAASLWSGMVVNGPFHDPGRNVLPGGA